MVSAEVPTDNEYRQEETPIAEAHSKSYCCCYYYSATAAIDFYSPLSAPVAIDFDSIAYCD